MILINIMKSQKIKITKYWNSNQQLNSCHTTRTVTDLILWEITEQIQVNYRDEMYQRFCYFPKFILRSNDSGIMANNLIARYEHKTSRQLIGNEKNSGY